MDDGGNGRDGSLDKRVELEYRCLEEGGRSFVGSCRHEERVGEAERCELDLSGALVAFRSNLTSCYGSLN